MTLVVVPNEETPSTGMPGVVEHGDQSMSTSEATSASTDVASLSALDPASQEIAVTSMLDQARQWLERAKVSTTPAQDVADFKAFISTVAEAAKQKQLSEEIQMDAVEMVRRSERALGLAIRDGQSSGTIAKTGDIGGGGKFGEAAASTRASKTNLLDKPGDFFAHSQERADIYAMTDDVTEEEFEVGLSVAREQGNLSRKNTVRTVTEVAAYKAQQSVDKWEQIEEFAGRGFTSTQIAKSVGMSEQWLRKQAADRGVYFPADKITGSRRIDSLKVLEKVVASYEASADAIDLVTYEDVTPELAAELLERLNFGIKAIRQLMKALDAVKQEIN